MTEVDTCDICKRPFSFIRAKVTDRGKGVSFCLSCGVEKEREVALSNRK